MPNWYNPFIVLPEALVVLAIVFPFPLKQKVSFTDKKGQLWFLKQSRKCAFGDHLNMCVTEQVRATLIFTLNYGAASFLEEVIENIAIAVSHQFPEPLFFQQFCG